MLEENFKIHNFAVNIVSKTNANQIDWKRLNPTTFYFDKNISKGNTRVSIQKIKEPQKLNERYIFIVRNLDIKNEILNIDSAEDEDLQHTLELLYNNIVYYLNQKGLDTLDELLR